MQFFHLRYTAPDSVHNAVDYLVLIACNPCVCVYYSSLVAAVDPGVHDTRSCVKSQLPV